MSPKFRPKFRHDCTACHFVGTLTRSYFGTTDIYLCPAEGGTLIARFGNARPDYASSNLDCAETVAWILRRVMPDGAPLLHANSSGRR